MSFKLLSSPSLLGCNCVCILLLTRKDMKVLTNIRKKKRTINTYVVFHLLPSIDVFSYEKKSRKDNVVDRYVRPIITTNKYTYAKKMNLFLKRNAYARIHKASVCITRLRRSLFFSLSLSLSFPFFRVHDS